MDIINIIVAIATIINFVLAGIVYFHGKRSGMKLGYSLVAVSVGLWSFSMVFYRIADSSMAMLWAQALYISASFIESTFLYFAYLFPASQNPIFWKRIVIIFSNLLIVIAILIPGGVIREVQIPEQGERILFWGPFYYVYILYIVALFYWAFLLLIKKIRHSSGLERTQLWYIFFAFFVAANLAFIGNLILPTFGYFKLNWLGQVFTFIEAGIIAFAIVRHQLLNVKTIAAEILISVIITILVAELFFSTSTAEFFLRIGFLIVVSSFSFMLVRSVINEVRQKEQLAALTTKLEAANKELERLDQAKSEFLSIASHQLRTPLTAIKGYTSMLLDGTFGPVIGKAKEGIDKVYASTERMVELVNDLLDTSRLESGRMMFNFVEADLGEITKSVCDELMPKTREKGLSIACAIGQNLPKIFVDQMKIRQVLVNFVDNAVKYSDTGTVETKLEQKNDELIFSVHDNGWGMTEEEMGFLFKKFSRGRGDTSHIKGTGLGLYVCRRLAEAHGGRVWAESPGKGQGSTFFLAVKIGWKPTADGVYIPKDE